MRLIAMVLLTLPLLAQQLPNVLPPSLTDVLTLTSDQPQKISLLFADYSSFLRTRLSRMGELNSDLARNFAQPSPDPAQIGADYAEAESIRRELVAKQASYRAQVRAVLTAGQQARYQALLNSITLQPLLSEASCAFLQDPQGFAGFLLGTGLPSQVVSAGLFSPSPVSVFVPFIPPPPGPTFCGSPMFPLALREFLNVTDPQVAAIAQASAEYNDLYQRRQDRIADVQLEIRDENAKDQPDPMALGVRYVELQLLSKDLQDQAARLRQKARAALTGDQATRLKTLDELAAGQPALSTLQGCDLLVVPPGSQVGPIFSGPQVFFDPTTGTSCRVL